MKNILFEPLFNNTIEGILIIEDGFIVDINSAMLDILSYSSKDGIIGKLATGILIPNIKQNYLEYNNEVYEEVSLISKDGNIVPAIIKIKDIEQNDKVYKMVFIQNLTELKQRESLLVEQSRMAAMGEMISMIAHQWRQPLSSISSVVSGLKFRMNIGKIEEVNLEDKLSDIEKYIYYMSDTIDDFRNFFKTDKTKELVKLSDITYIAIEMLNREFKKNNIEIINNVCSLKNIYTYKNEILQVILNILNNSKDAFLERKVDESGMISINYIDEGDSQVILISDNAGGIPEDIVDKIFDPYFSTKDQKNGTGLGLYMCKTIMEKHCNGEISVVNTKDGVCFKIKIGKFL